MYSVLIQHYTSRNCGVLLQQRVQTKPKLTYVGVMIEINHPIIIHIPSFSGPLQCMKQSASCYRSWYPSPSGQQQPTQTTSTSLKRQKTKPLNLQMFQKRKHFFASCSAGFFVENKLPPKKMGGIYFFQNHHTQKTLVGLFDGLWVSVSIIRKRTVLERNHLGSGS